MKFKVMMEFNEGILPALHKSPAEFASEIRLLAAAKWYEMGVISQEKAAEVAGMKRLDFLIYLRVFMEVAKEISHVRYLRNT